MISTVQDIQKNLMIKSEKIMKYEMMIKEKENIYTELKKMIARQPGR